MKLLLLSAMAALMAVAAQAATSTTVRKSRVSKTEHTVTGKRTVSRSDGTGSEESFESTTVDASGSVSGHSVHAQSTCADRKLNLAWLTPIVTDQRSLDLSVSMKKALKELQHRVSEEYYNQFGVKIITYDLSVTWNGGSKLKPDMASNGELLPYKIEPNAFKILVSDSDGCILNLNVPVKITDINECALGEDVCTNAQCVNEPTFAYSCDCNPGYKEIADCQQLVALAAPTVWESIERKDMENCFRRQCAPINVCEEGTDTCSRYDVTKNTGPAECIHLREEERSKHEGETYLCRCLPGYTDVVGANAPERERGRMCVDIDECALGEHSCSPHARCVNTMGSYKCECPNGWDMFDSGMGPDGCRLPTEVPAGHDCPCRAEVCELGDPDCHMHPLDRCNEVPIRCFCPDGSTCVDGQCVCEPGYYLKDDKCVDFDECATNTHKCSRLGRCENIEGGYKCVCDDDIGGSCITDTPHCLFEGANINLPEDEATIYQYDYAPDVGYAELVVGTKDKVSSFGSGGDIGLHFKIDFSNALEMAPPAPDRVYVPGDYIATYTIVYKQCDAGEQKGTTRICKYRADGVNECANRPEVTISYQEKSQTKNFILHVLPRNECREKEAIWAHACTSKPYGGVCTDTEMAYKCRCDEEHGWVGNGFQPDEKLALRGPKFENELRPRVFPHTNISDADAATNGERDCVDVQAPTMKFVTPAVPIRRCRCGSLVEEIQVPPERAICSHPVPLPRNVVLTDVVPQSASPATCDSNLVPSEPANVTHACFKVMDNNPDAVIHVTRTATKKLASDGSLESLLITYEVVDSSNNTATFVRTVEFIDYDVKSVTENVRDMLILAGFVAPLAALIVLLVWNFYPIVMMFRIFIGLPPNNHQAFEAGALLAERLLHPFTPVSDHLQKVDTMWHEYLDSLEEEGMEEGEEEYSDDEEEE